MSRLAVCLRCHGDGTVPGPGGHPGRCSRCGGEGTYSPRRPYQTARRCPSCGAIYSPSLTASDRATRLCTWCDRCPEIRTPGRLCLGCNRPVDLTGKRGRPRLYCSACHPRAATMPIESRLQLGGPSRRREPGQPGGTQKAEVVDGIPSEERRPTGPRHGESRRLAAGPGHASLAAKERAPGLNEDHPYRVGYRAGRLTHHALAARWTGSH